MKISFVVNNQRIIINLDDMVLRYNQHTSTYSPNFFNCSVEINPEIEISDGMTRMNSIQEISVTSDHDFMWKTNSKITKTLRCKLGRKLMCLRMEKHFIVKSNMS
jgi:hypothetical protein